MKCLLIFGIAKPALAVEHWERTVLQGWLEFSEVAVEQDAESFLFFILKTKLI